MLPTAHASFIARSVRAQLLASRQVSALADVRRTRGAPGQEPWSERPSTCRGARALRARSGRFVAFFARMTAVRSSAATD